MTEWDPEQYARYREQRSRPFADLVGRIRPATAPRLVVDLGCGTGTLTAELAERWPSARVLGVDSSPAMLVEAERHAGHRVTFERGDLAEWSPTDPVDVLLSNAALQWVPHHERLVPRLAASVAPGGVLAFQVPGNFAAPSHRLLLDVRRSPRWAARLGADADRSAAVLEPERYVELLAGCGFAVDAWETTYLHLLPGHDAVLEWVKGTALRPVLSRLRGSERDAFLADYGARLRAAYPSRAYGTVFPFRRIFVVASRSASG